MIENAAVLAEQPLQHNQVIAESLVVDVLTQMIVIRRPVLDRVEQLIEQVGDAADLIFDLVGQFLVVGDRFELVVRVEQATGKVAVDFLDLFHLFIDAVLNSSDDLFGSH